METGKLRDVIDKDLEFEFRPNENTYIYKSYEQYIVLNLVRPSRPWEYIKYTTKLNTKDLNEFLAYLKSNHNIDLDATLNFKYTHSRDTLSYLK